MHIELTDELTSLQRNQWHGLLETAKTAHPEQDPRLAPSLRADGNDVLFALGWEGDSLSAVGMFSLRPHPFLKGAHVDGLAYSGPVCDDLQQLEQFLDMLIKSDRLSKVGRLRITPYWLGEPALALSQSLAKAGWRVFETEPIRHTGLISLEPSEEQIYQNFKKGARYEYRKASRLGLEVEFVSDPAAVPEIFELMSEHRAERRMGEVARPGFLACFDHVYGKQEMGVLMVVRHEGEVVAGMSAFCGHHTLHPSHYFTVPEKLRPLQNLRIAPFIWYQLALWGKSRGAGWLDVEGYKDDTNAEDKYYFVHKYKGELGTVPVLRTAGHARVINPFVLLTGNGRALAKEKARQLLGRT